MATISTKQIRNLTLVDRLYNLFKCSGGYNAPPELGQNVQPVIDMDLFNGTLKVDSLTTTNTSDTHTYTVPDGHKWILYASSGNRDNAGDITIGINPMATRGAGGICNFETYTAATIYRNALFNPMTMSDGDYFRVTWGAGTSGNLVSRIMYLDKDA